MPPRAEDAVTLVDLIAAIRNNLGDAMTMCLAAEGVFNHDCPPNTDACLGSPLDTVVGFTLENSGYFEHSTQLAYPSPLRAGCDPAIFVNQQLASSPVLIRESIAPQLQSLGLTILKQLHFDLNQDGVEEWLVWLDLPVRALLFYAEPGDTVYRVTPVLLPYGHEVGYPYSSSTNPYYDAHVPFATRPLPDQTGLVLINELSRRYDEYDYWCLLQRYPGDSSISAARTVFTLWRMNNGKLTFQIEFPFCESTSLETVFGDTDQPLPLEITAWAALPEEPVSIVPATYQWDTEQKTYVVTELRPPVKEVPDYTLSATDTFEDAETHFKQGNYFEAKQTLEAGLRNPALLDDEQMVLRYLYALTLEALHLDNAALAEYNSIAQTHPKTAWGMLAVLHLGEN